MFGSIQDEQVFLSSKINGSVFLDGAGHKKFFRSAGLSFGASVNLAKLAGKIIGGKSKCCHSTSCTSHRQPANDATGECEQAGFVEPSVAS